MAPLARVLRLIVLAAVLMMARKEVKTLASSVARTRRATKVRRRRKEVEVASSNSSSSSHTTGSTITPNGALEPQSGNPQLGKVVMERPLARSAPHLLRSFANTVSVLHSLTDVFPIARFGFKRSTLLKHEARCVLTLPTLASARQRGAVHELVVESSYTES